MAILVQQDPDDPSHSYVFWLCAGVLILFVVVAVIARFAA
jgi:hypothetical protein